MQSTTPAEASTMGPFYDGLFEVQADGTFTPMLAESWKISDDRKALEITLAKNVKFHDGAPFNAAAVKSDLDWKLSAENKSDYKPFLTSIASVEAKGEYDVVITMKQPDVLLLTQLSQRPGHITSPAARTGMTPAERTNKPTGPGSFKLVRFTADDRYVAERWPNGFGAAKGYPYLDSVEFLLISDPAVALASYRAGDVDARTPSLDQISLLKQDSSTILTSRWTGGWHFLNPNPKIKPLDDVRVRKAMSMAVDREGIVQAITFGEAVPIYGMISPNWAWAYDPNYKKYAYDLPAAKKLLAEAGYPNGFTVGPVTWFGKESRLPFMNLAADQLKQLGITLQLQMVESAQASVDFRINRKTAMYHSSWSGGALDIDTVMRDWYDPKGVGWMWDGFVDPSVTQQLAEALANGRSSFDPAERGKWYHKAEDIVTENMLSVSVFADKLYTSRRSYVQGYRDRHTGGGPTWYQVWLDK